MSIETRIKSLNSREALQSLLVEELGFDQEDQAVFFDGESGLQSIYRRPAVIAGLHGFSVLVLPATAAHGMLKTRQRQVVEALRNRYSFALFIFADLMQENWHWVFPQPAPGAGKRVLRRMEIGRDPRLHTIAERLELLKNKLPGCVNQGAVAALVEQAFDVEAIGKAFFREYQEQYRAFKLRIIADNQGKTWIYDDDKLSRFVQLLLGRIMFLHFIEKKGWLNDDRNFIRNLFTPFQRGEQSEFYRNALSPVFFEALNKPGVVKHINGADYAIRFLNGGLFEARAEFEEGDSLFGPLVSDALFTGLFGMLGRYNFTVDESTSLDQTVGIDPEMLGKVFENLLEAEARHASGTYYTPRGIVEYMCRESLFRHLHAHTRLERHNFNALFDCALEGRKPEIEIALAQRLEAVLDRVTVLDPAVGSGAFLLGMMQEILTLKESLARARGDSEERIMAERAGRKAAIIYESLYAVDISFPAIEIARLRLWLALVVDEAEPHPLPNLDYHILRGDALRTLLDGKPLLPPRNRPACGLAPGGQRQLPMAGAQISLDEGVSNPHTEALLRHLNALYTANGDEKSRLRQEIRGGLAALIESHWAASERELRTKITHQEKLQHQGEMQFKSKELALYQQHHSRLATLTEQRRKLKESRDKGEELELPFTPLHLYFAEVFSGDNPGFDIVIANPPYVRNEEIKTIKPQLASEFPSFYCSKADLYTYFYKRGLELLKDGGHLCFIAQNKFMRAGYGENTRKLLTSEATPRVIIDFGDTPVFDATAYPAIVLVEKNRLNHIVPPPSQPSPVKGEGVMPRASAIDSIALTSMKTENPPTSTEAGNPLPHFGGGLGWGQVNQSAVTVTVAIIKNAADIERVNEVIRERGFAMQPQDLRVEGWTLESPAVLALMAKLRAIGIPLGEYVQGRFYYGIKTGFNNAFVINAATRTRLIAEDPNSAELIKPWLRGRDIRKWKTEWAGSYVIAIASSANQTWPWSEAESETEARSVFNKVYPAVHTHLSQWEDFLKLRNDQGKYWWELRSCAYYAEFEELKIVYPNITKSNLFAFDNKAMFANQKCFIIPTNDLYLLAVLNSKLVTKWFFATLPLLRGAFFEPSSIFMERLPIFPATDAQKFPITQRVQTILTDPSSSDVPRLEAEIDELVFDLYNLTDAERALVGGNRTLAEDSTSCQDENNEEPSDDPDRTEPHSTPSGTLANETYPSGEPAPNLSAGIDESRPALDGLRAGAGRSGTSGATASAESTTPLDATRHLVAASGPLTYTQVSEQLALRIVECLETLVDGAPEAIHINPAWIAGIHRHIAGEMFPDWAGKFRTTDVQVGSHTPPACYDVPTHMKNYCLDLAERLLHAQDVKAITELLAWADWRFQWIHPFKDFNGRVGRIVVTALLYKMKLPPLDPAPLDERRKATYLEALKAADEGNLQPLNLIWLERFVEFAGQ